MKKSVLFTLLCLLGFGAARTAQAADEIYGVLSADGKTFTIRYDGNKSANKGVTPDDWTAYEYLNNRRDVETIVFDASMDNARPNNLAYWFENFWSATSINNMQYLHTDNVTDMAWMFQDCALLTSIDVNGFNTAKVTKTKGMFQGCKALKTILCNNDWSEGIVTQSADMFKGCTKLVGGNGTAFDAEKTDIEYARPDGWNDMPGYFTARKEVYSEFVEATGTLTYYYDTKRNSREGITKLFENSSFVFSEYKDKVTKAVVDASMANADMTSLCNMFSDLSKMTEIEGLSNLNTANVTNMGSMFNGCKALSSLNFSSFNTENVTDMSSMFEGCTALSSLDLSSFNTAKVTDMRWMFRELQLTSIDLSPLNTDNVTNMAGMFMGCSQLTSLDLSSFNTAKVTNMSTMFRGCSALTSLDLSSFNTANVTDMENMFTGCSALTAINLSSFNTEKVTRMDAMFYLCKTLASIDLSSFNTANVKDMSDMFEGCEALTSLDIRSFNTEKVTDMRSMFAGCQALTSIDLNSFNTDKLDGTEGMFYGCEALTTIYCNKDWTEGKVTASDDMFTDCKALVGGNGTTYDAGKVDIKYALPDGLDSKPGYFTAAYTHAVTLIAENGTINVEEDVDLDKVPYGMTLHLTATPDENYEFAGWTNYDPETGLKVVSDITVTATFNLTATYRVTAVSADDALGEVTLTFDSEDIISKGEEANDFTVVPNAVGHLVATPKDKYTGFVRWNDEAEGFTLAERDITVTGDFDYIATFHKDSFSVSVSVEGIDPALVTVHGAGKYGRGDNVTLTYTLNDDNYYFDMWLFDKNNFEDEATLQFEEIDDHHDVRIVFRAKYYAVSATVIPAEAGVVKGQGDYEYGTDYTLTLEPAEGWELKEWRDGEALDEKSNVLTGYVYGEIHIECVLQKKEATALDAAEGTTGSAARKLLRNGILLIERNGKTYTAQGSEL